ncbi:hypothetical protein CFAM422_000015 [Trichoderma lentiforme]|uniref:Uncharacterized protein n=1 Tax=Trichoderma lentiforme TaxID=1567552 RepID=A0A9P4XQE6_9HYPO|nr:hypothetical protein CFAM422_000015 [Trichoderma lentiforme]
MSTTKRPQALARLAQSASSTPCGSNEMDASSRTRAQSGAAPDTSMRPNGSPLPPGGPASSISQQAPAVAPSVSVQPTASGLASPSARSLPLPCSLALLLFSSSVCLRFCFLGPPERPDRSRTNPPLRPMAQAVRLPSCAASPDMQQPRASVS